MSDGKLPHHGGGSGRIGGERSDSPVGQGRELDVAVGCEDGLVSPVPGPQGFEGVLERL